MYLCKKINIKYQASSSLYKGRDIQGRLVVMNWVFVLFFVESWYWKQARYRWRGWQTSDHSSSLRFGIYMCETNQYFYGELEMISSCVDCQ